MTHCQFVGDTARMPNWEMDLVRAVFFVNAAAKRFGVSAERRKELYDLKSRGIVEGVRMGLLKFDGWHENLPTYSDGHYCFHSHIAPVGEARPAETVNYAKTGVSRQPLAIKKQTVRNAVLRLRKTPADIEGFVHVDELTSAPDQQLLHTHG